MTASAWDKFLLLSWKNWIIQIRHPIQTLFEVAVPVILCALAVLVRGLVDVEIKPETSYPPMHTQSMYMFTNDTVSYNGLAFSPPNPVIQGLVQSVSSKLGLPMPAMGLPNAVELSNWASTFNPYASIEFDDNLRVSCAALYKN